MQVQTRNAEASQRCVSVPHLQLPGHQQSSYLQVVRLFRNYVVLNQKNVVLNQNTVSFFSTAYHHTTA